MGYDKLFSDFADNNQATETKRRRSVTANYRGGHRQHRPLSGAASNVTRYIYKDGVQVGKETIVVKKRR